MRASDSPHRFEQASDQGKRDRDGRRNPGGATPPAPDSCHESPVHGQATRADGGKRADDDTVTHRFQPRRDSRRWGGLVDSRERSGARLPHDFAGYRALDTVVRPSELVRLCRCRPASPPAAVAGCAKCCSQAPRGWGRCNADGGERVLSVDRGRSVGESSREEGQGWQRSVRGPRDHS